MPPCAGSLCYLWASKSIRISLAMYSITGELRQLFRWIALELLLPKRIDGRIMKSFVEMIGLRSEVNPNLMDLNHYMEPKTCRGRRKDACFRLSHRCLDLLSLALTILLRNWPYSLVRTVTTLIMRAYECIHDARTWPPNGKLGYRRLLRLIRFGQLHALDGVLVSELELPKAGVKITNLRKTDPIVMLKQFGPKKNPTLKLRLGCYDVRYEI